MNANSCNYNSDAEKDDGSCIAKQGCNGWCEGDSSGIQELDCNGECGGTAVDSDGNGICDTYDTQLCFEDQDPSACKAGSDCWYATAGCTCASGQGAVVADCGTCDTDTGNDCVQSIYDVDGNGYSIIIIGTQDWFQQNLKTTKYNNGDEIYNETFDGLWNQLSIGAWCNYDNDESNASTYGRLYNFYTLYDERGICPEGSRVPTDEDWKILEIYLGMDESIADGENWRGSIEGGKLKSVNNWDEPNEGATNESGFTAIPAGHRNGSSGDFILLGREAYFWASTYLDSIWLKNMRGLSTEKASIRRDGVGENAGNSIRCIIEKDCAGVEGGTSVLSGCDNVCNSTAVEDCAGVCGGTMVDANSDGICDDYQGTVSDVDGNTYKTIKIGEQWWMAEDLKVTNYRDGNEIPNITNNDDWGSLTTGAYGDYDNNPTNSETYGRLYNWYTVDDDRGVCPVGWHVPSDAEYTVLTDYLGGLGGEEIAIAGEKMKEAGFEHWNSPNYGATNESGFTALPGGCRTPWDGYYVEMGSDGYCWSSSENNSLTAWHVELSYGYSPTFLNTAAKRYGFSIRCLKD